MLSIDLLFAAIGTGMRSLCGDTALVSLCGIIYGAPLLFVILLDISVNILKMKIQVIDVEFQILFNGDI